MQLTHYSSKFKKRQFPIILICDNVANTANVGSLFRTADAFGIEKIIFCGNKISFGRKMTKTSRSTEKYVHNEWCADAIEVLQKLKLADYQIVALEIDSHSTSLFEVIFDIY